MYVFVKPKLPAAARERTDSGAIAFVEYYWAAVEYGWGAPDANILTGLSLPERGVCTRLEKTARDSVEKGEKASGDII